MLWAAAEDMASCKELTYSAFLVRLRHECPNVLGRLNPLIIQYFVHLSAGLPLDVPSLVVFVWDQANVAAPAKTEDFTATFLHEHLSAVVSSRKAAWESRKAVDVLLVPVVASTEDGAACLLRTSSKKAVWIDRRLPLVKSVDDWALIVMDLIRRLPLPQSITLPVTRQLPLSAM
jgi:hypothetical protein